MAPALPAPMPLPATGDTQASMAAFERALGAAGGRARAGAGAGPGLAEVLKPFARIQAASASLSAQMSAATEAGRSLTPGEMAMLTVRCHAFMFQCQLTASVAHRSADGVQQLLRQQA
jgi:hypothetical protein